MKLITVECPECRLSQDLPASCLLLEIVPGAEDSDHESSATWICHTCQRLVALPIDLIALLNLVAAGASVLDTELETRPGHPESAVDGSPFTLDDLIDFHEQLQDDALLAETVGCGFEDCR